MRPHDSLGVLFLGDVVGRVGRVALAKTLPILKDRYQADLVIVNCENATHGRGCSHEHYEELLAAGADLLTSGNHFYDIKAVFNENLDWSRLVRPINLGPKAPLEGVRTIRVRGRTVRVINALGAVEMGGFYERPIPAIERVLAAGSADYTILDFHAEATGEKICTARYLDGRITLQVGTHTHIQTNDERILPKGTGYITDLGFCGLDEGCLGAEAESAVMRTAFQLPVAFNYVEHGAGVVEGIFAVLGLNNRCLSIEKVRARAVA